MYNVGLYNIRQHYHAISQAEPIIERLRPDITADHCILKSKYIPFMRSKNHPFKDFNNDKLSKQNENYSLMLAQSAQQTLKSIEEAYTSFFRLLDKKKKADYHKTVGLPQYQDTKIGRYKVDFPRDSLTIKGNKVTLGQSFVFRKEYGSVGKELTFKIPASIKPHQIREVSLIPIHNGKCYKISFSYEIKKLPVVSLDPEKYLGIDLGVNNFASLIDNATGTAHIIDGKYLKSLNRWYNKTNAKLQCIKDKQGINGLTTKQHRLIVKRDNKISEALNRYVDWIIKYAISNRIGNIVCLRWDGIKQNSILGKINNQNFVQIPYHKFRSRLEGKCTLHSIKYHGEESEAYTSRTDALALDEIKDQPYGTSRRIKRGLYKSVTGHLINADVNGAINQIRKVAGNAPAGEIASSGLFNRPVRIRLAFESANFLRTNLNQMCCSTGNLGQSSHL
jgi:putative transposase